MDNGSVDSASAQLVITLVHGTFARWASWTAPESLLRKVLLRELGQGVVFERFQWSGLNGPRARENAAILLRQRVQRIAKEYPDCRQVIIAHSHGGNVARYAMNDADTASHVKGIICLSTPFIHAQPRAYPPLAAIGMVLLLGSPVVTLGQFVINVFAARFSALKAFLSLWSLVVGLILGAVGAFAGQALAKRHLDRLAVSANHLPRLLIIRTTGDEAAGGIATAQFVEFLIGKLFTVIVFLSSVVVVTSLVILLLGTALGVLHTIESLGMEPLGIVGTLWRRALSLGASSLVYFAHLGAAAVTVTLVAIGLRFLSGLGFGTTSLFLEISVETSPSGEWSINSMPPRPGWILDDETGQRENAEHKSTFLSHSATYNNPDAVTLMANWIAALSKQ